MREQDGRPERELTTNPLSGMSGADHSYRSELTERGWGAVRDRRRVRNDYLLLAPAGGWMGSRVAMDVLLTLFCSGAAGVAGLASAATGMRYHEAPGEA